MVDFAIPVNDPRHVVAPNTFRPAPMPKIEPMPDNSVGKPEIGFPNTAENSPDLQKVFHPSSGSEGQP